MYVSAGHLMEGILHPVEIPPPKKKTTMTMDKPPFEDVFAIEHGESCHVSFQGCTCNFTTLSKMNLSFTSTGLEGLFASTKLAVFLEGKHMQFFS